MAAWVTPRREGENQSEYTAAIDPSPGEIISPEADEPESVADEAPADEAPEFPAIADDHKTQGSAITSSAPGNEIRSRSEEHTSELQSLMGISYAVFCLKQKTTEKER